MGSPRRPAVEMAAVSSYVPAGAGGFGLGRAFLGFMIVSVRAKGRPASLSATLREEVRKLDADVAVAGIATLESLVAESIAPQRFGAFLLAVFASAAVLLAGVGVYGVMNYVVSNACSGASNHPMP